ncbi:hypothetical protein [Parapedobacter sp. DT-150]|uniref:hypothetical protein n=1 Tax=Parapedobacter sp. DT-150 TaxID=3396162 RepID=UPI003F1E16A0
MNKRTSYILLIGAMAATMTHANAQDGRRERDPSKSIKEQLFPDYSQAKAGLKNTRVSLKPGGTEESTKAPRELIFENYNPKASMKTANAVRAAAVQRSSTAKLPSELSAEEAAKTAPSSPPSQLPPTQEEGTKGEYE